jgi:hypothetical protein
MPTVFANSRTIVHKGDGLTNISAPPDVCKTPGPPTGPVPVPYVNIAQDAMLAQGTKNVTVEGNPAAIANSNLAVSAGDEPGSAGGVISAKIKGKLTWLAASPDVKLEGKGVVRFAEPTMHNGNTGNATGVQGGMVWHYGDDPIAGASCPACGQPKATHQLASTAAAPFAAQLLNALMTQAAATALTTLKKKGKWYMGYMVGVLLCKGMNNPPAAPNNPPPGKIYAAMTGKVTTGFTNAISALRANDIRWELATTPFAAGQLRDCNQPPGVGATFQNGFATGAAMIQHHTPLIGAGGNNPGACAAPNLIQHARAQGHFPDSLYEFWFDPLLPGLVLPANRIRKITSVTIQSTWTAGPGGGLQAAQNAFNHGDQVPSCETCQYWLTPMLCGNQGTACG